MNKQFKLIAAILILVQGIFIDSAFAQAKYGAIAISSDMKASGSGTSRKNLADAENKAKKSCNNQTCDVVISFANECAAVAKDNYTWYSGRGNTKKEASNRALKACGNNSCETVKSVCAN